MTSHDEKERGGVGGQEEMGREKSQRSVKLPTAMAWWVEIEKDSEE